MTRILAWTQARYRVSRRKIAVFTGFSQRLFAIPFGPCSGRHWHAIPKRQQGRCRPCYRFVYRRLVAALVFAVFVCVVAVFGRSGRFVCGVSVRSCGGFGDFVRVRVFCFCGRFFGGGRGSRFACGICFCLRRRFALGVLRRSVCFRYSRGLFALAFVRRRFFSRRFGFCILAFCRLYDGFSICLGRVVCRLPQGFDFGGQCCQQFGKGLFKAGDAFGFKLDEQLHPVDARIGDLLQQLRRLVNVAQQGFFGASVSRPISSST